MIVKCTSQDLATHDPATCAANPHKLLLLLTTLPTILRQQLTMTKRKAGGDLPSKPKIKKAAALSQQKPRPESPAARAYRHRRGAKLAHTPSETQSNDPKTYDVYDFPSALPSPPPSTRQTPPAVPKVDSFVLEDDQDARNDTKTVNSSPTISDIILDEDRILDILCYHFDDDLTEDAFEAIMRHAAAAAKPGAAHNFPTPL